MNWKLSKHNNDCQITFGYIEHSCVADVYLSVLLTIALYTVFFILAWTSSYDAIRIWKTLHDLICSDFPPLDKDFCSFPKKETSEHINSAPIFAIYGGGSKLHIYAQIVHIYA